MYFRHTAILLQSLTIAELSFTPRPNSAYFRPVKAVSRNARSERACCPSPRAVRRGGAAGVSGIMPARDMFVSGQDI